MKSKLQLRVKCRSSAPCSWASLLICGTLLAVGSLLFIVAKTTSIVLSFSLWDSLYTPTPRAQSSIELQLVHRATFVQILKHAFCCLSLYHSKRLGASPNSPFFRFLEFGILLAKLVYAVRKKHKYKIVAQNSLSCHDFVHVCFQRIADSRDSLFLELQGQWVNKRELELHFQQGRP